MYYKNCAICNAAEVIIVMFYNSDQDTSIYFIFVILFNTQISFGNVKGRMVIDEHNYNRVSPLLPCAVAKGLAQGMAADLFLYFYRFSSVSYHTIHLIA